MRPAGSDHGAGRIDRAPHIVARVTSRFLRHRHHARLLLKPVMWGPLIASCTEPTSTRPSSIRFLDRFLDRLQAASRLTTTPRFSPRLRDADANDIDAAVVEQLTNHGAHLEVPMSRPTTYRPVVPQIPPIRYFFAAPALSRGAIQPFVEPQIHVIDRVSRSLSAGARSMYCCKRATNSVSPRRSSAESPSRIATEHAGRRVELRDPLGNSGRAATAPIHARGKSARASR